MQGEAPSIKVDIDVQAEPKQQDVFEVVLKVRAEARAKEQLAYLLEVEYAGIFTLNVPNEHLGPVVLIECPMILFPFLRRIVADLTGDGGFAPLMLSPIDFAQLYQQRAQQAAAEQQAQQA
jgi:preprotein translocase subunit SecB